MVQKTCLTLGHWTKFWWTKFLEPFYRENMSSQVCNPGRFDLDCSATEASKHLGSLDIGTVGIILSGKQITQALIRLYGCAGWYVPVLFPHGINDMAPIFLWMKDLCIQQNYYLKIKPCVLHKFSSWKTCMYSIQLFWQKSYYVQRRQNLFQKAIDVLWMQISLCRLNLSEYILQWNYCHKKACAFVCPRF